MSKSDWYRRTTWSDADRDDFNSRLERSRGAEKKAQYLRIQAVHLAEVGYHATAIELLDRLFAEFPQPIQLALAHTQKADSLAKLGQIDAALQQYRAALDAERRFPNVRTNAWLEFGWLVVTRQVLHCYDETAKVLLEFREEGGPTFPAIEYQYAVIQAILADASGEHARASAFAKQAMFEAAKDYSGLRYHPTVGLVKSENVAIANRLRVLAGS